MNPFRVSGLESQGLIRSFDLSISLGGVSQSNSEFSFTQDSEQQTRKLRWPKEDTYA
jgi:hypothetical protein